MAKTAVEDQAGVEAENECEEEKSMVCGDAVRAKYKLRLSFGEAAVRRLRLHGFLSTRIGYHRMSTGMLLGRLVMLRHRSICAQRSYGVQHLHRPPRPHRMVLVLRALLTSAAALSH